MKKVEKGTGITKQTFIQYDTASPDDAEELKRYFDWVVEQKVFCSFEERLNRLEAYAKATLEEHGFPTNPRAIYRKSGGKWTKVSDMKPPYATLSGLIKQAGHEQDSVLGYAFRMLDTLRSIRMFISRGDALNAAQSGFELGALLKESDMKEAWEREALSGKKVRDAALRGGRPKMPDRNAQMVDEFLRRKPRAKKSDSALKAEIGARFGLSRSAAISAINKKLQKTS